MKRVSLLLALFYLHGCTSVVEQVSTKKTQKLSFQSLWNELIKDPYKTVPQTKVSYFKLSSKGRDVILENSQRTLRSHADLIAPFEKLAHPNGICFKGVWEIYHDNPYGGYFKKGSKALIIARASSAMSNTHRGETRAFGLAGKLFATMDKDAVTKEQTANFFLIDDLGGTDAVHFGDVPLRNAPPVTTTFEVLKHLAYGIKVAKTFAKADKNPGIRQLYEISYLGEDKQADIITPKWMKVELQQANSLDADDFRDALRIQDGEKIVFDIFVASKSQKVWQKIGTMTFDASIVSKSCDQELHFHHPLWRDDLKYLKGN